MKALSTSGEQPAWVIRAWVRSSRCLLLASRTFVLRNKRRTNLTLGLIRLHLNGVDIERDYGTRLREHLDASGGVLPAQRSGKDTGAGPRTDRRHRAVPSLRI